MINIKTVLLLGSIILFYNAPLHAEEYGPSFHGGPKSVCSSYMIFESGFLFNLSTDTNSPFIYSDAPNIDKDYVLPIDIGYMKNIGEKTAFGGSAHLSYDGTFTRYGISPRFQFWMNNSAAVDIAPGLFWFSNKPYVQKGVGKMITMSIQVSSYMSFDFMWDSYRIEYYQLQDSDLILKQSPVRNACLGLSGRAEAAFIMPILLLAGGIIISL